jgi:hypothetical protein
MHLVKCRRLVELRFRLSFGHWFHFPSTLVRSEDANADSSTMQPGQLYTSFRSAWISTSAVVSLARSTARTRTLLDAVLRSQLEVATGESRQKSKRQETIHVTKVTFILCPNNLLRLGSN